MEINALYETAKNFAGILKQNYPHFESDPDACLALIIADSGDIYSGVSSVTINEGTPEALPAENIAAMSLVTSGAKARQMIIITLEDYGFFEPNENALRILVNASPENGSCQVALSPEEASPAAALLPNAAEDFMSGYDDTDVPETTAAAPEAPAADAASLGAPAEFANGFDVDETNEFAASGGGSSEVKSFYDQPADAQQQGASGFNNPYAAAQQGVNPQQGGFQQGYPQQGGYPQQNPYGGNPYQQQNMNPQNAAPYRGGYPNPSVHVGSNVPSMSAYQSQSVMNNAGGSSAAFKKRLSNFLGEEEDGTDQEGERLSKEDMLKMQKDKKKVAKASNNMKKKM